MTKFFAYAFEVVFLASLTVLVGLGIVFALRPELIAVALLLVASL
jgi:hypothetical protein